MGQATMSRFTTHASPPYRPLPPEAPLPPATPLPPVPFIIKTTTNLTAALALATPPKNKKNYSKFYADNVGGKRNLNLANE